MNERLFRYQLIRYVPDVRRMEPQNVGVIVQDDTGARCRLWSHFRPLGDKPDFDFANFRRWREFFQQEVNEPQIPLFQPPRNRPEFLDYLQARCRGNYLVTRALELAAEAETLAELCDDLYDSLVRRGNGEREPAEQPVQRFREAVGERKLERNPRFRVDEYVELPGQEPQLFHWLYDRNHGSQERVLIDAVQWLGRVRETQYQLEHAVSAARKVRKAAGFRAHLIIVMDDPPAPSREAKDTTKRLYENVMRSKSEIGKLTDEFVNAPAGAEDLVGRIEQELASATTSPPSGHWAHAAIGA